MAQDQKLVQKCIKMFKVEIPFDCQGDESNGGSCYISYTDGFEPRTPIKWAIFSAKSWFLGGPTYKKYIIEKGFFFVCRYKDYSVFDGIFFN